MDHLYNTILKYGIDKKIYFVGSTNSGKSTLINKLIKDYGSIEEVLKNIDNISGKKLKENLETYSEQAIFSKKLATIMTEVPIDNLIEDIKVETQINKEALKELLTRLKMKASLQRFIGEDEEKVEINTKNIESLNDLEELLVYVTMHIRKI